MVRLLLHGDSTWRLGKTKNIRFLEALEDEIMAYARARDKGRCLLRGNNANVVLSAIATYIEIQKSSGHSNQHNQGRELDLNTRVWDEKVSKACRAKPRTVEFIL